MPQYTYRCTKCNVKIDVWRSINDFDKTPTDEECVEKCLCEDPCWSKELHAPVNRWHWND